MSTTLETSKLPRGRLRTTALAPRRLRGPLKSVRARLSVWPPVDLVLFGLLRRMTPLDVIDTGRGTAVDRIYVERFLAREAAAIYGDVLEVGGRDYARRFGRGRVRTSAVLDSSMGAGPDIDYIADLTECPEIPSASFDCVILPQTLLFIYDVRAAVRNLHRILKPGGIALVTAPGITQAVPDDKSKGGQFWSFTEESLARLFGDIFGRENVHIASYGNVFTTTALLYGVASEDLRATDFASDDPNFPLILTVRATRGCGMSPAA